MSRFKVSTLVLCFFVMFLDLALVNMEIVSENGEDGEDSSSIVTDNSQSDQMSRKITPKTLSNSRILTPEEAFKLGMTKDQYLTQVIWQLIGVKNKNEVNKLLIDLDQIYASTATQKRLDETVEATSEQSQVDSKPKGQIEYVTFVEPDDQKVQEEKQQVAANLPENWESGPDVYPQFSRRVSRNLLAIAVATILGVGMVVVIAAGLFMKRQDKMPHTRELSYSGATTGNMRDESALTDETLAYKAQLHKISKEVRKNSNEQRKSSDENRDSNDDELKSVYEYAEVTPTGDIEVRNPNFNAVDR